jgi:hypothetical protein
VHQTFWKLARNFFLMCIKHFGSWHATFFAHLILFF